MRLVRATPMHWQMLQAPLSGQLTLQLPVRKAEQEGAEGGGRAARNMPYTTCCMERAVHDVLYARCADMASFAVCQHKLSMLQQPSSHTRTQFHTQWPCGAHPMEHASLVGAGLLSQLQALGLLTTRNTPPRRAVLGRAWGGGAAGGHHPAGTACRTAQPCSSPLHIPLAKKHSLSSRPAASCPRQGRCGRLRQSCRSGGRRTPSP
jgi:hypothetical protein